MPQGHPDRGVAEHPEPQASDGQDRWLTIPNALSVLRLAGVPLFLWLLLGPQEDMLALLVLIVSGITDWLDGKLARWLNQASRLGAMLDPAADRLYTAATLIAFVVRDIVPWWVAAALVARDLIVGIVVLIAGRRGYAPPTVLYLGKAATFVLMYAFPLLLLTVGTSTAAEIIRPLAYAMTAWGVAVHLWSGALYVMQVAAGLRLGRPTGLAGAGRG